MSDSGVDLTVALFPAIMVANLNHYGGNMNKQVKDLTGQGFGKLVVVRPTNERKHGQVVWECQCDCGNLCYVRSQSLVKGSTKSCGCLSQVRDLTGMQFGELTVIGPTDQRKNKSMVWECLCSCGKTHYVASRLLVTGQTKSCGHTRRHLQPGKRFGRLVTIRRVETPVERVTAIERNRVYWECQCDCGNVCVVRSDGLLENSVKGVRSCGCLRVDRNKELNTLPEGEASFNKLYNEYKRGAKERGYTFELGKEWFMELTSQPCFYCGSLPSQGYKDERLNGLYVYNGVDRTDNTIGYTADNCVPCCGVCNKAKGTMPQREFLDLVTRIYTNRMGDA